MSKQWTVKYLPRDRSEVQGQDAVIEQLDDFIMKFKSQTKKGLILYGKHGTGKTSCIYAIANESDLEVLEINASDFRNKDKINSIVGGAVRQMSLFSKGKIILVDDIDGLSGNSDRGGVSALSKLIKTSAYPIVMTANDPYAKKFSDLRKVCLMVQTKIPSYLGIAKVLNRIVKGESIKTDDDSIKALARRAGGDIRAAINDLQSLAGDGVLDKEKVESLSEREHKESLNNALMRIFKTTDPFVAKSAMSACDEPWDSFMLWLGENLPREYNDSEDLAAAYDKLSRADVFNGRIRRMQHYRFLSYINDLLSAGVALSKKEKYKGFVKYERPKRLLSMYIAKMRFAKRDSIAQKLSTRMHISKKTAIQQVIPYMKEIVKKKDWEGKVVEDFGLSDDEMSWLKG